MCLLRSADRYQKCVCVHILSGLMEILYLSFVYLSACLKEFAVFDICVQAVWFTCCGILVAKFVFNDHLVQV